MYRLLIWAMIPCASWAGVSAAFGAEGEVAAAGQVKAAVLTALPAVIRTADGPRQLAVLEVESEGLSGASLRISKDEWARPAVLQLGDLAAGRQRVELQLPVAGETGAARVEILVGAGPVHGFQATWARPREWTVYLVQHTHTDIGYTWRQSEILPEHLRYIDEALDLCDATDGYPEDARFRWTCEVAWTVAAYLDRRPASQIERLKRRVAEGRIEPAGMFLNMSEIATESSLAASLRTVRRLREELGADVRTAMQNDVNGAGWCLPDYFSGIGIRYLVMGVNQTRSILPFDKPTAFWWESPSGRRTLTFRGDHYMGGNFWGIHDSPEDVYRPRLLEYLRSLEDRRYPFDRIAVQLQGYVTDNSRPSMQVCDAVRAWNEKYAWPKLRMATAGEFPAHVEAHHADELPVHRQAWPDWWTDGFGSAARETAESREVHAAMQTIQGLLAMGRLLGGQLSAGAVARVAGVQERLLFYDEHTFGSENSISEPMAAGSLFQWGEKGSFVWEAVRGAGMLREEAFGILAGFLPRADVPMLVVFNTLGWPRTGMAVVHLDSAVVPRGRRVRLIDPVTGQPALIQGVYDRRHGTEVELWARDVPPLGYRAYRVEILDGPREAPAATDAGTGRLENDRYALTLDPRTAAVASLRDRHSDRELVDAGAEWNLGQLVYERLGDRKRFEPGQFRRTTVRDARLLDGVAGPIYRSIRFEAAMDGCAGADGVRGEIRLYEPADLIELHYTIRKQPVAEGEAVYVALPFQWPESRVVYEAQGGCVTPGRDQLPGSSSDWHTVQRFAAVRGTAGQIVCASNRVPLMQFGGINLGRWQPVAEVPRPHLYSWVMNNYWFTNFRATQEGDFSWSCSLTTMEDSGNAGATRFGWNACVPMGVRVVPAGPPNGHPVHRSLLRCDAENLLLVETRPAEAGDGIVLHWRETEGRPATLDMESQPFADRVRKVEVVDVLERPLQEVRSVSFAGHEAKFVKVTLK